MRCLFVLCFALLNVCLPVTAQSSLAARLDPLWTVKALRGGVVGVEIVDTQTGKVLYARNPDTRLLPASNAKLFTAAAALTLLGENFTWTTKVVSTQKPDAAGVVGGDVYLVGSGDASLMTADIEDLAKQMQIGGVKEIIHSTYPSPPLFTDGPYGFGWEWDDFSDEEFPQISALTVNDGDVVVTVKGGDAPGKSCDVTFNSHPLGMHSTVVTTASGPPTVVAHYPYDSDILSLSGSVPVGQSVTLNVPVGFPDYYAAQMIDGILMMNGVRVHFNTFAYDKKEPGSANMVLLASHTSAPLSVYVTHMLKESDNLYAECLVRTVGVQKGTGGTFQSGLAAELPAFQTLGIDMTGVTLVDGCGVGRRNFVTARAVCQLLVGMRKSAHWKTWYNALPIAGVDGTLKSRMKGTPAANNCHAKTGTLGAVRALSGYVTGKSGRVYAFSVLLNNFPGTAHQAGAVQDALVETLATRG